MRLRAKPDSTKVLSAGPKRAGAFRRLVGKPLGLLPVLVLSVLTILAIVGPALTIHDPSFSSLQHVNAPLGTPGWLLGGDGNGHDVWARIIASLRVSFISAMIGTAVGLGLGSVFGLLAGYVGNRTDAVLSWIFNLLMTFPSLVLIIVLFPITGGSYKWMMFIFGFFLAPGIFRLVRNQVVAVRNELYVDAAKVAGLSTRRILSRHILYVVRGPLIIAGAFLASSSIGVQAGLAFLGFGSTNLPSFGAMTNDAFANIYAYPVQLVWPTMTLALLNGSLVLLGNAYRDALGSPAMKLMKSADEDIARQPSAYAPSPEDSDRVLVVRNLNVGYTQTDGTVLDVVRGVSLDIDPAEVVGLVGESGSGKTQTAFAVLGLLPPEARVSFDAITIAGVHISGEGGDQMRELRGRDIAYIPQEPMSNLDPAFTVGSQLVEGLAKTMSKAKAKETVLALLARVGIDDPARTFKSYPHQISGGMAQRVLIAGAVATRPKLLIADEPTTALDVTVQAEILDLLRDLQQEFQMAVLLVTHNFGVVADLCDRVIVMRSGEFVESGAVRDIFHRPQHEYTQQLIAAILDEETIRSDAAPIPPSPAEEQR